VPVTDAHRGDGRRYVVRGDEKLSGFYATGGDGCCVANNAERLERAVVSSEPANSLEAYGKRSYFLKRITLLCHILVRSSSHILYRAARTSDRIFSGVLSEKLSFI
jgi:hypothetical protein